MNIFLERVRSVGLPLDTIIVIGSGVLAVRGIREARDIDLVVTKALFAELEKDSTWHTGRQGSVSHALEKGDIEVWTDWSTDGSGHPTYEELLPYTESIGGVRFVTLDYTILRKAERSSKKDLEDIRMIHEYTQRL